MSKNVGKEVSSSMNEDDTFRALRKTPIQNMNYEYTVRMWEFRTYPEIYAGWLAKNGWNDNSFREADSLFLQSLKL